MSADRLEDVKCTCGPGDGCTSSDCAGTPASSGDRFSPTARCGQCGWACGHLVYPHPRNTPDRPTERPGGVA